ncbi:MAG: TIGR03960 family B12-binding radical SAM protein, partial [Hyphomonadaceae bacterium]|nr:TIGR03960 family B12-binding radical SAM protein [Clostridia bacterium]
MHMINDRILSAVQKPARYIGNEYNSVVKDKTQVKARFAFCFPDVYEVGMSHLGMKILYHILNARAEFWCERVFAPWVDMEEQMRLHGLPLFALESGDAVSDFDLVGFTLQYEMSYSNIVNMLDLASIPLFTSDRKLADPFVCAGGPCAYNGEPIADFVDFFMLGEGEEVILEVMDAYVAWKESGQPRIAYLETIAKLEGVYVPSFYDVQYNADGTVQAVIPNNAQAPKTVKKRIIKDLNNVTYPDRFIVPFTEIVHDRMILEIFRGCVRGCRFCQAGVIYRPVRERTVETLMPLVKNLIKNTGYEEISLASLSTSDYTALEHLTDELVAITEQEKISLALPSLRVDSFSVDLMEKVQKVRKSGLTFAPEAGTQRLRDVINKGVTESDLEKTASLAFGGGWTGMKLYFMIGLPTETIEDVEGIATLSQRVVATYFMLPKEQRQRGVQVTISTSSFVPKPFTPFQWFAQDSIDTLRDKQKHLKNTIKSKQISYHWHESYLSFLEAIFARGDRRLSQVLKAAHQKGCKFDGWSEFFNYNKWMEAFLECGIDPHFYATRTRPYAEVLPWDHID